MDWLSLSLAAAVLLAASTLFGRQLAKAYPLDLSLLGKAEAYSLVLPFALFSLLGSYAFLLALRQPGAKAGIVAAVTSLNVAVVAIISSVFFGEALSLAQMAGIGLALASIFLLSIS